MGLDYPPLTTPYHYESNAEDYASIIRNHFNKRLHKSKHQSYSGFTLQNIVNIANTGFFNWLGYQPVKKQFVIKVTEFVNECNRVTNHSCSFADLMSEFGITDYTEEQVKVQGKNRKGVKISDDDLIYNILDINYLVNESITSKYDDESSPLEK